MCHAMVVLRASLHLQQTFLMYMQAFHNSVSPCTAPPPLRQSRHGPASAVVEQTERKAVGMLGCDQPSAEYFNRVGEVRR
jgi:hypothetical protein